MNCTVLVIEDDPLAARLVDIMLRPEGFQVVLASNGLQGLRIANTDPPGLVLLDLMLPGLDGFEVLNRLRATPRTAHTPVVIISAKSQAEDREMAMKVGADAYLPKPYEKRDLLATIQKVLGKDVAQAAETGTRQGSGEKRGRSPGTSIVLTGPDSGEIARVALYVGLALSEDGEEAAVADLRPFSVEHPLLLGMTPPLAPVTLAGLNAGHRILERAMEHADGLRLLGNLEGGGGGGQLTPDDVVTVVDAFLSEGLFGLVQMPLYPADLVKRAADRSDGLILVAASSPGALAAARSALTMMVGVGLKAEQVSLVLVGSPGEEAAPELGMTVLGWVPAGAGPDDPAIHALADRLRDVSATG